MVPIKQRIILLLALPWARYVMVADIGPAVRCPSRRQDNSAVNKPQWRVLTSSSAVAKRPRDASCLSVVSFNSTKRRVESFIVSYIGYKFITACSALFCCLWRNVEASCQARSQKSASGGLYLQIWMHWTVTPSHIWGSGGITPGKFWNFVRKITQFCSFLQFQELYYRAYTCTGIISVH